ncbi:hypothetical protein SAMN06265222_10814 [Neorhodopirellula lusitana]|uniref:DUF4350 domain-containing protein n=1 Tax=Neorhodopirellula lusitana TaxID=445327 RepID=A0ABY1QCI2_9BACT|nr:hypothetical protein [Neorhodopirellula lusitana]SMP63024.1 hypothetical protein SAMN06265222_10814 [Neorhodopirellula lusitana]
MSSFQYPMETKSKMRPLRGAVMLTGCLLTLVMLVGMVTHAVAQDAPRQLTPEQGTPEQGTPAAQAEASEIPKHWIGINGHYRAGHWTAIHVSEAVNAVNSVSGDRSVGGDRSLSGDASKPIEEHLVLQTSDGDGVTVNYRQDTASGPIGYCVPGTEAAPLVIAVVPTDAGSVGVDSAGVVNADGASYASPQSGNVLVSTRFPETGVPEDGPAMIPLGMPWVLVFGDTLGIDTIGANDLLDRDASVAVTQIAQPEMMPDNVLGLSGVDLILITGKGAGVLSQLSATQTGALSNWVKAGGRVMVTLGKSAPATLKAAPWLAELLPRSVADSSVVRLDPSGMETYTNSQARLEGFDGLRLPKVSTLSGRRTSQIGETLIAGRTARRISVPLASRYVSGFGKITVVAADLDQAPFVEWPERFDMVTKLTNEKLGQSQGDVSSAIRLSGFSDLSGQVRRSLDQFSVKRRLSFSMVALVIVALITLVAPLDYFVVRRVLGNPLLGWLTFPIVAILMSIGLVIAAQPQAESANSVASSGRVDSALDDSASPNVASRQPLSLNSMEVLDVDTSTRTGRLFRWSFVYSHTAQRLAIRARPSESLSAITKAVAYQSLSPFGAPNLSMGGIQIDAWSDAIEVDVDTPAGASVAGGSGPALASRIDSLEIAPRGSKSLALSTQFDADIEAETMQRRGGSELLQGKLVNPLGVDLLDAMLVYQNWVYLLPTRFPAGSSVEDIDRLRQKNFRWQLSRQRALESSSEGENWDVTQTDQPKRLAEMMMFHNAVGGTRYTGLRNEVLGELDLSDLLTDDRCMLIGRVAQPWTSLDANTAGAKVDDFVSSDSMSGSALSWVRLLMPVEEVRR